MVVRVCGHRTVEKLYLTARPFQFFEEHHLVDIVACQPIRCSQHDAINFRGSPEFSADALHGPGVFETLRGISEQVLRRLSAAGATPGTAAGAGTK